METYRPVGNGMGRQGGELEPLVSRTRCSVERSGTVRRIAGTHTGGNLDRRALNLERSRGAILLVLTPGQRGVRSENSEIVVLAQRVSSIILQSFTSCHPCVPDAVQREVMGWGRALGGACVARIERSEIRDRSTSRETSPGFAPLNPGYIHAHVLLARLTPPSYAKIPP
jgi:hypothetical protein